MNSRTCVVAIESPTMNTILEKLLEENGYTAFTATCGVEALRLVAEQKPRFLLCSTHLHDINGFTVSRIVKNTSAHSGTVVILCTVDENSVTRFWAEQSLCDACYETEGDEFAGLLSMVHSFEGEDATPADSVTSSGGAAPGGTTSGAAGADGEPTPSTELVEEGNAGGAGANAAPRVTDRQLLETATQALERDLFGLFLVREVYNSVGTVNIEELTARMVQDIMGIIDFDAVGVVVNTEPLFEYYYTSSRLPENEREDFMLVARRDFEKHAGVEAKFLWERGNLVEKTRYSSGDFDTLKSYESFPHAARDSGSLDSGAIPGSGASFEGASTPESAGSGLTPHVLSLHLGSFKSNLFRTRNTERLESLLRLYEKVYVQAINYNRAQEAERKMRKAFSRFVPDIIVQNVLEHGAEEAQSVGEKRKIAVLITDIRDFTAISEINEPEQVVAFLNSYFAVMGNIIKRHGGIIDKFMGDAIMALFGAPESFPDNGNRAALAALEMHEAVKGIEVPLKLPEGYTFAIGTGIHYGEAIVGSIGSDYKKEYTVIGDSVNIASRTEGLTKLYGTPIVITDSVKKDLREGQRVRHLDNVKVKGKSVAIAVYELCEKFKVYGDDFLESYRKGLNQYTLGNFTLAQEYFFEAHNRNPSDMASMALMARCEEYLENPPDQWDGATMLTTK